MKRIGVASLAVFFLFFTAGSLFAQQTTTAGQLFDNSRPATGQGNEISTAKVPVSLPPPPPSVQGVPVKTSTGTAGGYNVNTPSTSVKTSTGTAGGYNVNTSTGTTVKPTPLGVPSTGSDIQRMKANPPPPPVVRNAPPPPPPKSPPPPPKSPPPPPKK